MATADKLWFELGVRDEVSKVLENLMRESDKLANKIENNLRTAFSMIGKDIDEGMVERTLKTFYRNVLDIANVFDKIHVTQKRINTAMSETGNKDAKSSFRIMLKDLQALEKKYNALTKNPSKMTEEGMAQAAKIKDAIDLLIKDSLRYVDTVEAQDRAEAKKAANDSRRIEDLKRKYYELQQYRKQLSDAIAVAAPGADLTDATKLINGITSRMSAVRRAQNNGTGMPASASGADYEDFLRRVKAETSELTNATDAYNRRLENNRQLQATLSKLMGDAKSQQSIAGIRRQTVEYAALGRKIQELSILLARLQADEQRISGGGPQSIRREDVTAELERIQRRYNETLAAGRQRELDDAAAKRQKTTAAHKQMEAISALANVNQSLISSYNRIAEAGGRANKISIQFQNQIGAYAGLYGLQRLLKSVVTIGGQFEVQHVALQNILGDIEQANILFGQLKELAIESPMTFMELTAYTKQLSAYQIPVNELFDTTKRLADMSAGLGVDMNRLILAYGQVRSAAVLRGQELRQFTEAGIPMVQALADKFTQLNGKLTTTADVFKLISQRAVPFEMVREVLWDMTSQGGQFFNMQEELANTLYGKFQKLQDAWQIMLGNIADGSNMSGTMLKALLDVLVAITQYADNLIPLLTGLGAAKGVSSIFGGINNAISKRRGETAIRNMEIAKLKEANRLERERIWNGRQLSAEEQKLVQNKNKLVSSDYQILALENQITAKKARQLMLDGQMSKEHFYRYLQMQGYTKEQIKQIALGNLQALQAGPNPQPKSNMTKWLGIGGKGVLGFLGGWVGVATTALGAAASLYQIFKEADQQLTDLANSISGDAKQNGNQLANTLKNVESGADESYKKVEALEEALLGMGDAGKQVVQDSRGFEDMNKRLESLTTNAKAYQEALETMGTPQGKAAIKESLSDSDLNDEMEDYEDLQNIEYKRMAVLERYSAKYQQMIESIKTKHKELNQQLEGKNLYESIRHLLTGSYRDEVVGYFAGNTPWGEAMTSYAKAVGDSEAHMNNIKDNVIPDAMNALRTLAREAGVDISKSYEQLTEAEKTKLRTVATNYANGLSHGSQEAKSDIASWLAQGFYAQLTLTPVINTSELSGLPYELDQWQKEKGYNLWSKNELKEANTDWLKFSKAQSQRKVDREKQLSALSRQLNDPYLDPNIAPYIREQKASVETELNQLNDSLKSGKWVFDKSLTKGNNSGGRKSDEQLKRWKEEWGELRAFYTEYKKWAKEVGGDNAIAKLRASGLWGSLFDGEALKYDIRDWGKAIDDFKKRNGVAGSSVDRRKFLFELGKAKVDVEFDVHKEALERELSELQEYIQRQTSSWNLYKTLLSKTGNKTFAMLAFQDGRIFDGIAEELSDELRVRMGAKVIPQDVWNMTDAAAKKHFEHVEGGYELWKRIVDITRSNYTGTLTKGSDALQSILTAEDKVLNIEREIAELRKKYANATDNSVRYALSTQIAGKQRELEQAKRDAFKESSDYLNFYNAILSLTIPQAEEIGRKIKKNLNEELKAGKVSARQYLTEIQNITKQLNKLRNQHSGLTALLTGGLSGYFSNRVEQGENQWQKGVDDLLEAERGFEKAVGAYNEAQSANDQAAMEKAEKEMVSTQASMQAAQAMMQGGQAMTEGFGEAQMTMAIIDMIIHGIDAVVQGIKGSFDEIREMYDSMGVDTSSGKWSDFNTFFSSFSAASSSATKGWESLKNGDIGGAIQGTIGSFTNWFTGFNRGHDAKLDSQIEQLKLQNDVLDSVKKMLERKLDRAISGIYELRGDDAAINLFQQVIDDFYRAQQSSAKKISTSIATETVRAMERATQSRSYYDQMYAQLLLQRDQTVAMLVTENNKKHSDYATMLGYQDTINDLNDQIVHFSDDMAKALYSIDFKSWAQDLSSAMVEAWSAGEDAAESYRNTVSGLLRDLGVRMITERFVAKALSPIMDEFMAQYESDKGVLSKEGMQILAKMYEQADLLDQQVGSYLNGLESLAQAHGESIKDDSGSSASSSIKNISENTADLLASYLNAIRADVSVNRVTFLQLLQVAQTQSEMPVIARAQLAQLEAIAANTSRNADAADAIYGLLHSLAPDGQSIKVK